MAEIGVDTVTGLMNSVGPTEEHRKSFARSFLGTVLGQTIVFVGMLLTYVVAIVLLNKYAKDDLADLYGDLGPTWFPIAVGAPFACILAFSLAPTAVQALRERRLKASVIQGPEEFKPGYFRLHPYGAADRASYERLDGADTALLAWLKSSEASVLYLSGASGVGKSSLLAADVLPSLRDENWSVVETRVYGDPVQQVRDALLAAEDLHLEEPPPEAALYDVLEQAAQKRVARGDPPLLIVIDQFEEFLILHDEEERRPFADLLHKLTTEPIAGLKLLLTFRSDYRPLIFKLDLPPPVANVNWEEVSPYDRGEATRFLQGGGRKLSAQSVEALLKGLDRIEAARGIYRPITLNMVGLVLERMGHKLEGDPARLIHTYLTTALTEGEARDYAKPLLAHMITEDGTKEPHSEEELAAHTKLEPWQVKAALADLSRKGLVRRLEGPRPVWEVSHDFLARTIGQLIGRLRPKLMARARPLVAPVVLAGWIALAVLAVVYMPLARVQAAEAALRGLGASIGQAEGGGRSVSFSQGFDDKSLAEAAAHLHELDDLTSLSPRFTSISDLQPLAGLTGLTSLDLSNSTGVSDLQPLAGLTNLTSLDLGSTGVSDLQPLAGLTSLSTISLHATNVTDVSPVKRPNVTILGP